MSADAAAPWVGSLHTVVEHLEELIETVNVDGSYYKARVEQPGRCRRTSISSTSGGAPDAEVGRLERRLAKVQPRSWSWGHRARHRVEAAARGAIETR